MPTKVSLPLRSLRVATPCHAKWDEMDGDDRKRFCHQCSKHVYNFESLNTAEIQDLLGTASVCGRFYQRSDGTVLTADCPVGVRLAHSRLGRWTLRTAAFAFVIFGAAMATFARIDGANSEGFIASNGFITLQRFIGRLAPQHVMGDISIFPTPSGNR